MCLLWQRLRLEELICQRDKGYEYMKDEAMTALDVAHVAVSATPDHEPNQLRFYEQLADGELLLMLEKEAQGSVVKPKIFDLEQGRFILAFDQEERLADFSGGVVSYATLPGRVIAAMLKGQKIGLGVNLGVAPSSMLLPPEALDWLSDTLSYCPQIHKDHPVTFESPQDLPEYFVERLGEKIASMPRLATAALLAKAYYDDTKAGLILAFLDTPYAVQASLAKAASELFTFSGGKRQELGIAFMSSNDERSLSMVSVALRFDFPQPVKLSATSDIMTRSQRSAPGMDPKRPPKLR